MATDSHRTLRAAEKEPAAQRREQGLAVAALNAFSTPDFREDARREHRFHEPRDAMQALTTAVDDGTLRIPRLFVLDSLVKLAGRRGERLRDHDRELDALLKALVGSAGAPQKDMRDVRDKVATVRRALASVSRLRGVVPVGRRWKVFTEQAGDALRLTKAEKDKPVCNDEEKVKKGSYEAVAVTVEFHTDATPSKLRHFCDPIRWHKFSAYQLPMKLAHDPDTVNKKFRNGWRRDLIERVAFSPLKLLVTPLRFTYTIENETNPSWVHLDYVLPKETEDIVVDEGALDVRRVTCGPHQGRTRVSAKKAILFTDPLLREWPTIACDTFWTDMVIAAAVGSSDDGGTPT